VDAPLELEEGPRDRMLAFTYWERALRDGRPEERLNRAQNPPDWPVRRVTNALTRSLEDARFDVRLAAMASLERMGAVGQPAICGALTSSELDTRLSAADALARMGDQNALEPLNAALYRCYVGKSPMWQSALGLLVWGMIGLVAFGVIGKMALSITLLLPLQILLWAWNRRSKGKEIRAMAAALGQIGERHPQVSLGATTSELRAASRDLLFQDRETRRQCRETATRIQAALRQRREFPIPSQVPAPEMAGLPRPAESAVSASGLPRVRP
jgi:HEAT repeat protein